MMLVGLAGHAIRVTCNHGAGPMPCGTDYRIELSVANGGDAAVERIDALDLRADGRSLLADEPIACDRVPWTVASRAESNPLLLAIAESDATVRVPCGPLPLTDVIVAPLVGGLPFDSLTVVELDVGGHLADGTRFSLSNRVDVTQP
ncbi:MAG TPA: hypothetical protein VF997_07185 [Polyangia bacterium]